MTAQKLKDVLLIQANSDFKVAQDLLKSGSYMYALFFGQLALEKILKGLIVHHKSEIYPPIHSLTKLAQVAGIKLSKDQSKDFDEITSFNIKARYDDVKFTFYKKATIEYASLWFNKIKEHKKWLESLI